MEQIPDAPYIREAERWGMPPYEEPPNCPVCGCSCNTVFMDKWNNVVGCDTCMTEKDAWEWWEDEKEANKPDWLDEKER